VIRARAVQFGPVAKAARQAFGRQTLAGRLRVVLVMLATAGVGAIPAQSSASAAALERGALAQAHLIRAEVSARYRLQPGRKLVVTEATSTGVVRSLTLITDWLEPWRVVPANNGIYFAICPARARCPYPARSAARPAEAFLPRRMALELALRTLLQTSVDLVVVGLPTVKPAWVVVEREELLSGIDARAVLERLASNPAVVDPLVDLVDRITRPRLFVPLPVLPPPDDTIYAVGLHLVEV
jgi:hypothetical protein